MKKSVIIGLISFAAVVGLVIVTLFATYVNAYNYGNQAERQIEAQYENMENILAQYSLKVVEMAQLPEMKRDDLRAVVQEAMTGRYGEDGSKAVFQWINENYPGQVDNELYLQVQRAMEAGRNKFENAQTKFIDTKRAYETNLGYFWKGLWLRIAGYPKIDLDEYTIITSGHAHEAFETGVDQGIKLR